jgi:hypothetical protein
LEEKQHTAERHISRQNTNSTMNREETEFNIQIDHFYNTSGYSSHASSTFFSGESEGSVIVMANNTDPTRTSTSTQEIFQDGDYFPDSGKFKFWLAKSTATYMTSSLAVLQQQQQQQLVDDSADCWVVSTLD